MVRVKWVFDEISCIPEAELPVDLLKWWEGQYQRWARQCLLLSATSFVLGQLSGNQAMNATSQFALYHTTVNFDRMFSYMKSSAGQKH